MRAATVVQQLCKSCRTCFMFNCMFYFTCDRSFKPLPQLRQKLKVKTCTEICGATSVMPTVIRVAFSQWADTIDRTVRCDWLQVASVVTCSLQSFNFYRSCDTVLMPRQTGCLHEKVVSLSAIKAVICPASRPLP